MEAIIASKLPTWKLEHFGLWADMCAVRGPTAVATPASAAELIELEDQASQARFRELRAKIAGDMSLVTAYNAKADETQRRQHVVTVMHERAQAQIGKQLLVLCFNKCFDMSICCTKS